MLLFLLLALGFQPMSVDPNRLAETIAGADEVIKQLRDYGDVPDIARPVEAYFYGSADALARLEKDLPRLGWTIVDHAQANDGQSGLTVSRDQTTDRASIIRFTEDALKIEVEYGITYDGWQSSIEKR